MDQQITFAVMRWMAQGRASSVLRLMEQGRAAELVAGAGTSSALLMQRPS